MSRASWLWEWVLIVGCSFAAQLIVEDLTGYTNLGLRLISGLVGAVIAGFAVRELRTM